MAIVSFREMLADARARHYAVPMFDVEYECDIAGTLTASPMAYVKSVLANENSDEDLVNLAKAIYVYGTAANGFFYGE